jgi:hypothetical protein
VRFVVVPLILCMPLAGCARAPALFSESNARAHIEMIAGTIGSRPIGTPANARARAYILDQLKLFGFEVRVQEADARRPEIGTTARVANIVATLPGARHEAVGLVAHYDSRADAPGATDDGLGVGVSLEAARLLAARANRNWSLMVLLTDGEEAGLLGAAALMTDREITRRLQAYLVVESTGASGPALLFETGPGNAWLVSAWARHAPRPRGASFIEEIYHRLPNDTDFSIIKRQDIPGLNFAPVGDNYAYHTARDTPERLSPTTVRETGENVVALVTALDGVDITQRSAGAPTFFDLAGTRAISYGPRIAWTVAALSLIFGVIAWVKVTAAAIRLEGVIRWLLTFVWAALGTVLVCGSMVAATWALRTTREVYHPWYSHPDRFLAFLLSIGVTVGWGASRLGQWLPARLHGLRHPLVVWSVTLPLWIALASSSLWLSPGAAYVWTIPLAMAGILLTLTPPTQGWALRSVSLIIFIVVVLLWLRGVVDLLRFMVSLFGRLPLVTPVFVYAALMCLAGTMLVPPLVGTFLASRRFLRPSLVTALLLIAVVIFGGLSYAADAYTTDRPLRRHVRALQAGNESASVWEVGSIEPGLDLDAGAPGGWSRASDAIAGSVPWGRMPYPFVFRTQAPALGPPPIDISEATVQPVAGGQELSIGVVPREPGVTVSFRLPRGLTPARHNLPGAQRLGLWTATFVAPPAEGIVFRASFNVEEAARLPETTVIVSSARFPGGQGWQGLPAWLPQQHAVWTGTASWAVRPIAPAAPLR